MKPIIKLLVIILITFIFLSVYAKENQNTQWKGKIVYENGVKVIKNPREPMYGEITFELEEDLSIGNEDDENYMFYRSVRIAVDSEENIFVLDRGNCRIQKFDRDGNYLQTIGRRGQGPGEFEQPEVISFDSEDNILVRDSGQRIHIFDKNGVFKNAITLAEFSRPILEEFYITKEGNILARTMSRGERRSNMPMDYNYFYNIDLINSEGKVIKTVASFLRNRSTPLKHGRGMVSPNNRHNPRLYLCQLDKELGVYCFASEYKLNVIDSTGDIVHRIEKDEPPHPLTKKDRNKVLNRFMESQEKRKRKFSRGEVEKAMNFPKYKPFFSYIFSDDEGRIYIKRFKSIFDEDKNYYYDLFSKEGYYLHKIAMPISYFLIKNGCVYITKYDQDTGYCRVKRFKIKNWEQIKEEI